MSEYEHQSQHETQKALTSIHTRIHCVATQEVDDSENELDRIAIDNFLDTVAEIAMAIARKKE